jgi:hypothetical protein
MERDERVTHVGQGPGMTVSSFGRARFTVPKEQRRATAKPVLAHPTPRPAVKVAISLPDDLLHRVDRARREHKVSRSEYFRQAATNLLGLSGEQEVEPYVRGYSTHPETPSEVEAARAASARSLAAEPWE